MTEICAKRKDLSIKINLLQSFFLRKKKKNERNMKRKSFAALSQFFSSLPSYHRLVFFPSSSFSLLKHINASGSYNLFCGFERVFFSFTSLFHFHRCWFMCVCDSFPKEKLCQHFLTVLLLALVFLQYLCLPILLQTL